jgi:hypothetical protein
MGRGQVMAFDPSTATSAEPSKFDPGTAKPVADDTSALPSSWLGFGAGAGVGAAKGVAKEGIGAAKGVYEEAKQAARLGPEASIALPLRAMQQMANVPEALKGLYEKAKGYVQQPETAKKAVSEEYERYKRLPSYQKGEYFGEPLGHLAALVYGPEAIGFAAKAPSLVGKATEAYRLSKGAEAEKLAKSLRTQIQTKAEDVISSAKSEEQAANDRIKSIAQHQEQLGAGAKVTAERQAAREQEVSKALDVIAPKTSRPTLPDDVGNLIQNKGRENLQKLKKARTQEAITDIKDPAFNEAPARETAGDTIASNEKSREKFEKVLSELQKEINNTTPSTGSVGLSKIMKDLQGTDGKPFSLAQAENMRRFLKDTDLSKVSGFEAANKTRLHDIGNLLTKAMEAYDPRLAQYISKYKKLSAPITKAMAGRGEALTDVELQEAEKSLFSADKAAATNYYLNGSRERAQRLVDLLGGKPPELVNSMRRYFRSQLEGMNATKAQEFARANEGLFRVFPEFRSAVNSVVEKKLAAETAAKEAESRVSTGERRLETQLKKAEQETKEPAAVAENYRIRLNRLESANPRNSVSVSKDIVNQLRKDKLINDVQHKEMLDQISNIETQYGKTDQAKTLLDLFLRKQLVYGGLKLGGFGVAGYYGAKALKN